MIGLGLFLQLPREGVTNADFGIALSANWTCQYPEAMSRIEKIVAP